MLTVILLSVIMLNVITLNVMVLFLFYTGNEFLQLSFMQTFVFKVSKKETICELYTVCLNVLYFSFVHLKI